MRLLLDTHALLWAVDSPAQLGAAASASLQDPANDLLISAATVWELAIKFGLKKLTLALPYRVWMTRAISDMDLSVLPITVAYADVQAALPSHHRDPFDRLLIAQATVEDLPLISNETVFDAYGIKRIWD